MTEITGATVDDQCNINIRVSTDCVTVKTAIVEAQERFLGLMAIESPEVLFIDVMQVELKHYETFFDPDPVFADVCEPGSLRLLGIVPEQPVSVGGCVHEGQLKLTALCPCRVTVTLAGIRKGAAGVRFPEFTAEQKKSNDAFWAQAHGGPQT